MRVAHFTETYLPQIGGITTSIVQLNRALIKKGHMVHVFTPGKDTKVMKHKSLTEHYFAGVRVIGKNVSEAEVFYTASPFLWEIDKIFERKKFDIIHNHFPYPMELNATRVAKKHNIPMVITCHGFHEEYMRMETKGFFLGGLISDFMNFFLRIYYKWYHNKCDAVIAPSLHTKILMETYGIKNVTVVPTGIDLKRFRPSKKVSKFRKKYGIGKENYVLYLGRISPEKNVELLVRRAKDIKAKILICGSGRSVEKLKGEIKRKKLGNKVKFLGFLPDEEVADCYTGAALFAMPSLSETQGLTVLESMACETPVVVFDSATAEPISQGKNGFIAKNEEEFIQYVNKILKNKSLRKKMSREAIAEAKKHSYKAFGDTIMGIYKSVIEARKKKKASS